MERVDLQYLCTTIGKLTGIPIRIFEGGVQTFYYSVVYLPKDPMILCRNEVFAIQSHRGCCVLSKGNQYLYG